MKIRQFAALALMGLALAACNKPERGEDPSTVEPEGKMVTARLAISVPNSIRTYAPGGTDPYATPQEIEANYIDVFVYENGGSYSTDHFHFERATDDFEKENPQEEEFSNPSDGASFKTGPFSVREGEKLVYVGINLPDFIVNRLKAGFYVNEIYEDPDLLTQLISNMLGGSGGSSNVAFFTSARDADNLVVFTAADNAVDKTIDARVSRLVAKVVVMTDGGSSSQHFNTVSGGTLTNFEFAIGQRNNQMFVRQLLNGQDPNHQTGDIPSVGATSNPNGIQKLLSVIPAEYKAVNDDDIDIVANGLQNPAVNVHYTTENTSVGKRHQDVTYISVRAEFIPHYWGADPTTGAINAANSNSTVPLNGFYAVFTGDNSNGNDALGARYFETVQDARAFVMGAYFEALVNAGADITFVDENGDPADLATVPHQEDATAEVYAADHYIFHYADSRCYYRIYLNGPEAGVTPTGTNYDVLRNTVYVANITGVKYIGTTTPDAIPGGYENGALSEATVQGSDPSTFRGTPTYPGDWFLPAGTAVFPDDVISTTPDAEALEVSISVDDWEINNPSDGYDLN